MDYLLGQLTELLGDRSAALSVLVLLFVIPAIFITLYFANVFQRIKDARDDQDNPALKPSDEEPAATPNIFKHRSAYDVPVQGYRLDESISREVIKEIAHSGKDVDDLSVENLEFEKFKEDAARIADRMLAEYATDSRLQEARRMINNHDIGTGKSLLNEVIAHEHLARLTKEEFNLLDHDGKERYKTDNQQFALAYIYLAALEWMGDSTHTAISAYKRATALNPLSLESWNRLGQLYDHIGNFERAIECYKEANRIGECQRAVKLQQIIKDNLKYLYDSDASVNKRIGKSTKGGSL